MQIGAKINQLRLENGMTQEELADRCELTKGYISQLERDLTSPSIATLQDMLGCLGISLQDFFSEEASEQVVFRQEEYFVKEEAEQGTTIHWIVPNAKKKTMEPIILEILPNCSTIEDGPHQGEEFGMVMNGTIILQLGKEKHRVKKGECFQFKTNRPHAIRNAGKTVASVLWISSPPSF